MPLIPEIPKALKHINIDYLLRKNKTYLKAEIFRKAKEAAKPKARQIIANRKKRAKMDERRQEHLKYHDKHIALVEVTEKIFHQRVLKFINKLVEKSLRALPEEVARLQNKQLFNEDDEIVQASMDFTPLLNDLAFSSGTLAMGLTGVDKPYVMADIKKLIEQRVKLFATSMVATDRDKLTEIIANGVKEGQSVPQIRQSITDTFDEYAKMQAERITRTEVIRVSNQAALDAFDQSGVVIGKQWLTAEDERVCDECEPLDGKEVYSLKGDFYSPESEFEDGDPPLHANCRCDVIPITE